MQYLPKPRAATSVATNIDTFPLRNSVTQQYHCWKDARAKQYQTGHWPYKGFIVYTQYTAGTHTQKKMEQCKLP
jgi:hypothetical protein